MKRSLVLLVEDLPDDQALWQIALEEAGQPFDLAAVGDGQQALDWLFRPGDQARVEDPRSPSLVLLDLKMPVMDGFEVLRRLRSTPQGRLLPVVVLTSSEMPADIALAYSLGASGFVQKPVGFQNLMRLVRAIQDYWLSFNVLHPSWR